MLLLRYKSARVQIIQSLDVSHNLIWLTSIKETIKSFVRMEL